MRARTPRDRRRGLLAVTSVALAVTTVAVTTVAVTTVAMTAAPDAPILGAAPAPSPAAGPRPGPDPFPPSPQAPVPVPTDPTDPKPRSAAPAGTTPGAWQAGPFEVEGRAKEAAARFVEQAGTWSGTGAPGAAEAARTPSERVVAAGYPSELTATAAALVNTPARAASTTVIYPQYGGLTDSRASVVVLARQTLTGLGDAAPSTTRELILDVRVRREAGTWAVTAAVQPPRPAPARRARSAPTPQAIAVLANPRVRLPGPARADVATGRVDDPILGVLDRLADRYTIDVQVLVTGHPGVVYPSTRLSNHVVGRAVDIRAIDGRPVIGAASPTATDFMVAAGRAGATEVGGPAAVPGRGLFTDDVHRDHVHLGITPTRPPARAEAVAEPQ